VSKHLEVSDSLTVNGMNINWTEVESLKALVTQQATVAAQQATVAAQQGTQVAQQAATIVALLTNVSTLQSTVSTLQNALAGTQANVTTVQGSVSQSSSTITSLQSALAGTQVNVTTVQGTVTTVGSTITSLESTVTGVQSNLTTVQASVPGSCGAGGYSISARMSRTGTRICWYRGGDSESCDTVCAAKGGACQIGQMSSIGRVELIAMKDAMGVTCDSSVDVVVAPCNSGSGSDSRCKYSPTSYINSNTGKTYCAYYIKQIDAVVPSNRCGYSPPADSGCPYTFSYAGAGATVCSYRRFCPCSV